MKSYFIVYFLTLLTVGLMSGLFYNWSFNITTGLSTLDDRTYLNSMQTLNRSILNPAFFIIFFGSTLTLLSLVFFHGKMAYDLSFWMSLLAMTAYLVGCIGLTIMGNIPLNNQLEVLNIISMTDTECFDFRKLFERKWNFFNNIRTVSCILCFILTISVFR